MSENSKISWTDHTFNPWVGCAKVSPACDNCYAESWAKRSGQVSWGLKAERKRTTPENWKQVTKWDKQARESGTRVRVFCASLADVFDDAVPHQWRVDLFELIESTTNIDWLLLTKRIHLVDNLTTDWMKSVMADKCWIGATVCNQKEVDRDVKVLLDTPAHIRFLSVEPLLGRVDLVNAVIGEVSVDWVIVGGESGHNARPMDIDWVRQIRKQCEVGGVPFHFKQWGQWVVGENGMIKLPKKSDDNKLDGTEHLAFPNKHVLEANLSEIFEDVKQVPNNCYIGCDMVYAVKTKSGTGYNDIIGVSLWQRTWFFQKDNFPLPRKNWAFRGISSLDELAQKAEECFSSPLVKKIKGS